MNPDNVIWSLCVIFVFGVWVGYFLGQIDATRYYRKQEKSNVSKTQI